MYSCGFGGDMVTFGVSNPKSTPMEPNVSLVASCGLYCAECRSYQKGKCPSCAENKKATWCGVRTCVAANNYKSCADCQQFSDPMQCAKFNNFMSKLFAFVFRSDRAACISMIKEKGYEGYSLYMAQNGLQTIKR